MQLGNICHLMLSKWPSHDLVRFNMTHLTRQLVLHMFLFHEISQLPSASFIRIVVLIRNNFFFSGKEGKLTVHGLKEFFKQVQKVKHTYDLAWWLDGRSKFIDVDSLRIVTNERDYWIISSIGQEDISVAECELLIFEASRTKPHN